MLPIPESLQATAFCRHLNVSLQKLRSQNSHDNSTISRKKEKWFIRSRANQATIYGLTQCRGNAPSKRCVDTSVCTSQSSYLSFQLSTSVLRWNGKFIIKINQILTSQFKIAPNAVHLIFMFHLLFRLKPDIYQLYDYFTVFVSPNCVPHCQMWSRPRCILRYIFSETFYSHGACAQLYRTQTHAHEYQVLIFSVNFPHLFIFEKQTSAQYSYGWATGEDDRLSTHYRNKNIEKKNTHTRTDISTIRPS